MKAIGLKICAAAMLALPVTFASCDGTSGSANGSGADTVAMSDPVSLSALSLGLGLIQSGMDQGATCVSPASAQSVLRLAAAGAAGLTRDELCRVADCTTGTPLMPSTGDGVTISTSNAVWIDDALILAPSYSDAVRNEQKATVQTLPLQENADQSAATINAWAAERTNGMVPTVIQPSDITANSKLVLTNAIYFKGKWAEPFKQDEVHEGTFHGSAREAEVMMMTKSMRVAYYESDQVKMLHLPYAGGRYRMAFILPTAEKPSIDALRTITADSIMQWSRQLEECRVLVSIPKFKVEHQGSLSNGLLNMGVRLPFTSGADFSGITGGENGIFMDNVLQSVAFEVNEEGTEAAAATAATMMAVSLDALQFVADKPFLYVLYDTTVDNAIFVGSYDLR